MAKNWGFDTKTIDKKVRPQDDFYKYAHGLWLKKAKIPAQESYWGSFTILRVENEKRLRKIVEELKGRYPTGSNEQMIRDLYRSGMDEARREKLGIKPLLPWLKRIENLKTEKDLIALLPDLERYSMGGLWGVFIDQDSKDSERYLMHVVQGGLGLPDRDYYLKDDTESKRVKAAYEAHVERLLQLVGYSAKEARRRRGIIMEIEEKLALVSMTKEDSRDAEKTYHKLTIAALTKISPQINWKEYFKKIGAPAQNEVVALQPEFLRAATKLFSSVSIEDWKVYLSLHLVDGWASALSKKFVREQFEYYGKQLAGQKKMKPIWRRALATTQGALGEPIGQLYIKQYFTPEAKKRMDALIDDLLDAYEARIKQLDWMTPETKKKAVAKLRKITRKIGYPDKWKSYKGLVIRADDYFGNILRSTEHEHLRQFKKLGKPIDRTEWHMFPQTVNAYCNFSMNEIVFPAGILQPPFFSLSADNAVNYGSIGSVIGHEITHAFDDQGSKFDGKGNMKSWWTETDRTRFEKKAKVVKEQFDQYKVADGVSVNGQLTLGENIADLGGASIAFDAYQRHLAKAGRADISGFTPEQRFFLGFSLFERELTSPEFEKLHALTNPHSPGIYRINGPVSNMPEFYKAFGLKKGDKLYREPKDRAKIW